MGILNVEAESFAKEIFARIKIFQKNFLVLELDDVSFSIILIDIQYMLTYFFIRKEMTNKNT